MPNFFERLFHRDGKDRGRIETAPPVDRYPNLRKVRQYFYNAGFTNQEIPWLNYIEGEFNKDTNLPFDQEFLNLLARLLPEGVARTMFFADYPFRHRHGHLCLGAVREIQNQLNAGQDLTQHIDQLTQALSVVAEKLRHSDYEYEYFDSRLDLCSEVLKHPKIYHVFGSDPVRLGEYLGGLHANREVVNVLISNIRFIVGYPQNEFVDKIMPLLTVNDLRPADGQIWLSRLLHNPEFFPLALKYFESGGSWDARLQVLWKSFEMIGLPRVTDQEVDSFLIQQYSAQKACLDIRDQHPEWADLELADLYREMGKALSEEKKDDRPLYRQYQTLAESYRRALSSLDKTQRFVLLNSLRQGTKAIREIVAQQPTHQRFEAEHQKWLSEKMTRAKRRENPRHPLISLGIARTIGFEVEYPIDKRADDMNTRHIYYDIMEGLGLKYGAGGNNCSEVSPGPFYDPETALAVLRMYSDIGFLDFYLHPNMTCHFNLGIRDTKSFAFLIWNMYLTGAAYNPDNSHVAGEEDNTYEVRICPNDQGQGKYLEGKVFDAMTQPALAWNLSCATYLSWAQSAADYVISTNQNRSLSPENVRRSGLNRYRRELALIWRTHELDIRRGAQQVGLGGIFHETIPYHLNEVLDRQIQLVYPDLPSRYLDPSLVSERKLTQGGTEKVVKTHPIDYQGRHYPNIVAYTTEMTNHTVAKIKEVEAEVEADCVRAIWEIETSPNEALLPALIDAFIDDFAVEVPENATFEDKLRAYHEVKVLFQDQL